MGLPIEPEVCSEECYDACMRYIGFEYDTRRFMAGIKPYTSETSTKCKKHNQQDCELCSVMEL